MTVTAILALASLTVSVLSLIGVVICAASVFRNYREWRALPRITSRPRAN